MGVCLLIVYAYDSTRPAAIGSKSGTVVHRLVKCVNIVPYTSFMIRNVYLGPTTARNLDTWHTLDSETVDTYHSSNHMHGGLGSVGSHLVKNDSVLGGGVVRPRCMIPLHQLPVRRGLERLHPCVHDRGER